MPRAGRASRFSSPDMSGILSGVHERSRDEPAAPSPVRSGRRKSLTDELLELSDDVGPSPR